MESEGRRPDAPVGEELRDRPGTFDFFRAVGILELEARARGEGASALPVGGDDPPDREAVRFRATPGLAFPESAVEKVEDPAALPVSPDLPPGTPAPRRPVEMTVGFFGLTGPSGALPDHYSVLMAKCVRLKDSAFREFSDVFNHRLVSLFYRAWEKTRLVPGMERALRRRTGEDLVSWCFSCLVGMGTGGLRGRGAVPDDALVYFGGGFSGSVRNAVSLRRMLSAYFEVPVDVEQFRGRWILLPQGDRSLLPSSAMPRGRQNRLGEDMILGDRCWDAQGAVRLRVGPVSREDFLALVPRPIGGAGAEGHMIGPLRDLARSYLGPEMDFDVQVLVPGEEIPDCVLGEEGPAAAVLGWSCWLRAGDLEGVLEDAVFGGSALS